MNGKTSQPTDPFLCVHFLILPAIVRIALCVRSSSSSSPPLDTHRNRLFFHNIQKLSVLSQFSSPRHFPFDFKCMRLAYRLHGLENLLEMITPLNQSNTILMFSIENSSICSHDLIKIEKKVVTESKFFGSTINHPIASKRFVVLFMLLLFYSFGFFDFDIYGK